MEGAPTRACTTIGEASLARPPRTRLFARATCACVLVSWTAGCERAPQPRASAPVAAETLRQCPQDDRIWERAIDEARNSGGLERFGLLASEIARTRTDCWQAAWAAGECIFQSDPAAPKGLLAESRAAFEQALARAEAAGDPVGVARAGNRLAYCMYTALESEAAEKMYGTALAAAEDVRRKDLIGSIRGSRVSLRNRLGRLAEALEDVEAAADNLRDTGREDLVFRAEYTRSLLLGELGQFAACRELLERLYREAPEAGAANLMTGICVALGNQHMATGDVEAARSWFDRVPDGDSWQPRADLGRGRLALREGRHEDAARFLDRAGSQDRQPSAALFARVFRAQLDLRTGNDEEVRRRLAPMIEDIDRHGSKDLAALARTVYGKALMLDPRQLPAATELFRQAVERVESTGKGLDPGMGGMTFLRERAEPFPQLAAALALQHGEREAGSILQVLERAHARALREILQKEGQAVLAAPALAPLQRGLAAGELLLDYLIGEDRGVLLAADRRQVRVHILPGWQELRPLVQRYVSALRRPLVSAEARFDPEGDLRRDLDIGRKLRRALLDPVAPMIERARRVYIVPDQDLALLPFAALPLDEPGSAGGAPAFLGEAMEVAMLPMAGVPASWAGAPVPLLLAGDPLPDAAGEFRALQLAAQELDAIAAVWGAAATTVLKGGDFVAQRLHALPLQSFRTLHFATHAVASSRDPRRCAVILSRGEKLGLQEVAGLRLGPALVVLSACSTGEGEVIAGEGVVGLSWAFLRAGAHGVVASLWTVEDASTTELMVNFHRNLAGGVDPVKALSLAQRSVAASRRHPVHWAPFVIVLGARVPA